MKTVYFLLVLLTLYFSCVLPTQAQLQGIPFSRYYSSIEYGGGIQNWGITQSQNGIIYVANNFGLLEYDGSTWRRYVVPNATKVRDVNIDAQGIIYVGSQGDFGYFKPERNGLHYISLAQKLPNKYRNFDETWRVFISNNITYFCTFDQIFIFKDKKFYKAVEPPSTPESFYFVDKKLYVSFLSEGLLYLEGDTLKPLKSGFNFSGMVVAGILPLANNHLWIATAENGIYTYNSDKIDLWKGEINDKLSTATINRAIRLQDGNFAIGTQNDGIFITSSKGAILQHLTKGNGLNNRTILSMYQDYLGNLWAGHSNGLTSVELSLPFTLINEQLGLPGTGYDGVIHNNKVYFGTNNGIYYRNVNEDTRSFNLLKNTSGQVYKIQNVNNKLLVGHHHGAFQIEENEATKLNEIPGAWMFLSLNESHLISGNYNGLHLYSKHNNQITYNRHLEGFKESSRVMEMDESGNIWMTHGYKGVFRIYFDKSLSGVKTRFYGTDDGLPSNILINVWRVDNRLIFTTESGIYTYNSSLDRFEEDQYFKEYFGNESLSFLEEDPLGNIYYISRNDIGVLQKLPNRRYLKKNKIFNRVTGLLNDDLQNLSVMNTDYVAYAAKEGFILYSAKGNTNVDIPFQTLIRRITLTGTSDSVLLDGAYSNSATTGDETVIPYDNNSLSFEYAAPFFHSSEKTLYQFKLEGLDQTWSDWTTKTDKEYTYLAEGRYAFHVRSKNIYDNLSSVAVYHFRVKPPWYRSPMAYILYVGGSMGFLGFGFIFLDARYRKEKKRMQLNQRKELNRKDAALKSSEEKIQLLKNEKLESELTNKNRQLAASTMHLVNKNSFIHSVKHHINGVIKRSKNQEIKGELNKIIQTIDKNITEDQDWDEFASHFDEVHGDFTKRIKEEFPALTPQELKLSAYLRMNLTTKEIAHLLNISVRGVEIARYRLRKKLDLDRSDNLQDYILQF